MKTQRILHKLLYIITSTQGKHIDSCRGIFKSVDQPYRTAVRLFLSFFCSVPTIFLFLAFCRYYTRLRDVGLLFLATPTKQTNGIYRNHPSGAPS